MVISCAEGFTEREVIVDQQNFRPRGISRGMKSRRGRVASFDAQSGTGTVALNSGVTVTFDRKASERLRPSALAVGHAVQVKVLTTRDPWIVVGFMAVRGVDARQLKPQ